MKYSIDIIHFILIILINYGFAMLITIPTCLNISVNIVWVGWIIFHLTFSIEVNKMIFFVRDHYKI